MNAIVLDEHRSRFRSEADFEFFVSLFAPTEKGLISVWAKKRHLATLLTPEDVKSLAQKRALQNILESPSLLDEVRDRLETDDIID